MAEFITDTELGQLSCIPADVLAEIDTATRQLARQTASSDAISYFATRYPGTVTAVGPDVKQRIADIAAYRLMGNRGYFPEGANDDVSDRYDAAQRWFRDVARGLITPDVSFMAPSAAHLGQVSSKCPRGW